MDSVRRTGKGRKIIAGHAGFAAICSGRRNAALREAGPFPHTDTSAPRRSPPRRRTGKGVWSGLKAYGSRRRKAGLRREEDRRTKRIKEAVLVFALLIAGIVVLYYIGQTIENNSENAEPRGDVSAWYTATPPAEIGDGYELREHVTTVLLMAVGHSDDGGARTTAVSDGRADYMLLLAIDNDDKTITPIQIGRSTIVTLGVNNKASAPVNLAYGREDSCLAVRDAVSTLLLGVDVPYYVAADVACAVPLNTALGGVSVSLRDDLSALDPAMMPGATLTLNGQQAATYLDVNAGDGASLMDRQQAFWEGCYHLMLKRVETEGDIGFARTVYGTLSPYLTTNLSQIKVLNMIWNTRSYQVLDDVRLEGAYAVDADGDTVFYPDADALTELVTRTFYRQAG